MQVSSWHNSKSVKYLTKTILTPWYRKAMRQKFEFLIKLLKVMLYKLSQSEYLWQESCLLLKTFLCTTSPSSISNAGSKAN